MLWIQKWVLQFRACLLHSLRRPDPASPAVNRAHTLTNKASFASTKSPNSASVMEIRRCDTVAAPGCNLVEVCISFYPPVYEGRCNDFVHRLTWELFSLRKPLHSSSTRYTIGTPGLHGWSSFAYAPLAVCDFRYEHISREIRISHLYGQPRMAGSHQSFFNNQENSGLVDVTSILVLDRFSRKTSMRNEWPAEVVGLKPAARFTFSSRNSSNKDFY